MNKPPPSSSAGSALTVELVIALAVSLVTMWALRGASARVKSAVTAVAVALVAAVVPGPYGLMLCLGWLVYVADVADAAAVADAGRATVGTEDMAETFVSSSSSSRPRRGRKNKAANKAAKKKLPSLPPIPDASSLKAIVNDASEGISAAADTVGNSLVGPVTHSGSELAEKLKKDLGIESMNTRREAFKQQIGRINHEIDGLQEHFKRMENGGEFLPSI